MSIARLESDWVGRLIALLAKKQIQSSDVLLDFLKQYIQQNQGSTISYNGIYVARPELAFAKKIVAELGKLQRSDNEVRMTRLIYLLNAYSLNRRLPTDMINFFKAYFSVFEIYKLYCSTPLIKQLGEFHVWGDYLTKHLNVLLADLGSHLQGKKKSGLRLLHNYPGCLLLADMMPIYQLLHGYLVEDLPEESEIECEIYSLVRVFKEQIPECYRSDIINGLFKRAHQHKDGLRYEVLKTIVVLQDWQDMSEQANVQIWRFLNELNMIPMRNMVRMGVKSLCIFMPFISDEDKESVFNQLLLLMKRKYNYTFASVNTLNLFALVARDLSADYHNKLSLLICDLLKSGDSEVIKNACLVIRELDFLSAEHFQPIELIHMSMLLDNEWADDIHCPLLSSMSHLFAKFTAGNRELYLEVLVSTIQDAQLGVNRRYCAMWAFKTIAERPDSHLMEKMLASMQSVLLSQDMNSDLQALALEIIAGSVRYLLPNQMGEIVDAVLKIMNVGDVDFDFLKIICSSLHCFPSVMESQGGLDFVNRHIAVLNDEKAYANSCEKSCVILSGLQMALSEVKKHEVIDSLLSLAVHVNMQLRHSVYDALIVYCKDMTTQQKIVTLSLAQQFRDDDQAKRLYAIIFSEYHRDIVRMNLMVVPTTIEDCHLNQDCADHVLRFM